MDENINEDLQLQKYLNAITDPNIKNYISEIEDSELKKYAIERFGKIFIEKNKALEMQKTITSLKAIYNQSPEPDFETNQDSNTISNNDQSQNMGSNQAVNSGPRLSLNDGHYKNNPNNNNSGFVNALIMTLLVGFAGGAIITAVYIFMSLGHVTVSL